MNAAIVLLAGSGERFDENLSKQFAPLGGRPLLYHSLEAFEKAPRIGLVVPVVKEEEAARVAAFVRDSGFKKIRNLVIGGKNRRESVFNALKYLRGTMKDEDVVLIHDGARPLLTEKIIDRHLDLLKTYHATATAVPETDTIALSEDGRMLDKVLPRKGMQRLQTPQGFHFGYIYEAHHHHRGDEVTDDAGLILDLSVGTAIVIGSNRLRKVTTKEDLESLEALLFYEANKD